jgi:hypothetical protein
MIALNFAVLHLETARSNSMITESKLAQDTETENNSLESMISKPDMSPTTSPCWDCSFPKPPTCLICSPDPPPQINRLQKPPNVQPPQPVHSLALSTIKRIQRMDISPKIFGSAMIRDDLEHLYKFYARTATSDDEMCTLTLLSSSFRNRPSITLTGPANDYLTMDAGTFNVLGNGHGMASSSGLRIIAPYAARSPHECEWGSECKNCLQAASASASFAEAMETLAKDRRISREWQRILYVLRKLERRRLERRMNSAGAAKLGDIWEVYWGRIGKANK